MKKWQISKIKIVDWYLDFCKESYNTTLGSVISSFKICLQNYGQLKVARYSFSGSIQCQYLPSLSINYAINKVLEKLPPQLL